MKIKGDCGDLYVDGFINLPLCSGQSPHPQSSVINSDHTAFWYFILLESLYILIIQIFVGWGIIKACLGKLCKQI